MEQTLIKKSSCSFSDLLSLWPFLYPLQLSKKILILSFIKGLSKNEILSWSLFPIQYILHYLFLIHYLLLWNSAQPQYTVIEKCLFDWLGSPNTNEYNLSIYISIENMGAIIMKMKCVVCGAGKSEHIRGMAKLLLMFDQIGNFGECGMQSELLLSFVFVERWERLIIPYIKNMLRSMYWFIGKHPQ